MLESRTSTLAARTAIFAAILPVGLSSTIAVNAVGTNEGSHPAWPSTLQSYAHNDPVWIVLAILIALWTIYRLAYREAKDDARIFVVFRTVTRAWKALTVSVLKRLPNIPYTAAWIVLLAVQAACIFAFVALARLVAP